MQATSPMYGFDKFWQGEVYGTGVDNFITRSKETKSHFVLLESDLVSKFEGSDVAFWIPIWNIDTLSIDGFCLYGREERNGKFVPVLEVKLSDSGCGYRVFARKNFKSGEVITLMSKVEGLAKAKVQEDRTIPELGFGGGFARIEEHCMDSNAYLSDYGALISIREIKNGNEIVRWNRRSLEYYERIGRLIVSPSGNRTGRISAFVSDGKVMVDYSDGTREAMDKEAKYGYVYREK